MPRRLLVLATVIWVLGLSLACAQDPAPGLNALPEIEFSALSQPETNPLGAKALALHPTEWKHAESEHFIYHFIHSYVATPISVEAEFCFRVLSEQLGPAKLTSAGRKSHIYIFEKPEDWKIFQTRAFLEPWTGGIHSEGSLFVVRDPANKFSNNSLGHEIAHLVLYRIYQRPIPPWLDEGFAEYSSRIARSSFQRARNYLSHPRSTALPSVQLIPLARLTTLTAYPAPDQIAPFYQESERLVRFLVATDQPAFLTLLDAVARGEPFETALARTYRGRFFDLEAFEKEFAVYAVQDAEAELRSR